MSRMLRSVPESYVIDGQLVRSADGRALDNLTPRMQEIYAQPATFNRKDVEVTVTAPSDLFAAIMQAGQKGLSVQRYKGLGEMNPEQLWETTLDPDARVLLQVQVRELAEADEVFTTLMGDVVEPRREFIQTNALNVVNLDI